MNILKKIWTVLYWLLKVFFILILIVVSMDLYFEISYLRTECFSPDKVKKVPYHTAAIVPGAGVVAGRPSTILEDRLKSALILYKNKKVKKILLSGDNEDRFYNEIRPMIRFMLDNKVNPADIFADYRGLRTYDTMFHAKNKFHIKDAVIVTQRFHQPRSVFIAKELGIQVSSLESDLQTYRDIGKYRLREVFAKCLAWAEIYLDPETENFTGDEFDISGNGTASWDAKDREHFEK